jgi:hypothetical protein
VTDATAARRVDARIVGAEIGAGHDGRAELVITLEFANGGRSRLPLDTDRGLSLLGRCGAGRAADLIGRSWHELMEALECST